MFSGLSPFLDDSIEETTANILKCDFCFPDEYFAVISNEAKDLLQSLLCLATENRASAERALASPWFKVSKKILKKKMKERNFFHDKLKVECYFWHRLIRVLRYQRPEWCLSRKEELYV